MEEEDYCYEGLSPTFIFKGEKHTCWGAAFIINETVCEISGPRGALEWSGIVYAVSARERALTWRCDKKNDGHLFGSGEMAELVELAHLEGNIHLRPQNDGL